jgi:hypothetical protein
MGRSQGKSKNSRSILLGENSGQVGSRKVQIKMFKNEEYLLSLLKEKYSWQLDEFWNEFLDKMPKNKPANFQSKLKQDSFFKEFIKNENDLLKNEITDYNPVLDKSYYLGGFNDLIEGNSKLGPTAIGLFFKQFEEDLISEDVLTSYVQSQMNIARSKDDTDNYMNWYLTQLRDYLLEHNDDFYGRELMPGEINVALEALRNTSLGVTPSGVNRGVFARMGKVEGFYPSKEYPNQMTDESLAHAVAKETMYNVGYSDTRPIEMLKERADQIASEAIMDHLLAVFEGKYSSEMFFTPTKSRIAQFVVHPNKENALGQLRPLAFDKAEEVVLSHAIEEGLNLPDDPEQIYLVLQNTASSIRKDPTMQVIRALVDELKALN